jgi:prolyl-tRNA synthetase
MRMSKLFSQTLKSTPADLEADSHKLLLRAGFIRQHAAGILVIFPWHAAPCGKLRRS